MGFEIESATPNRSATQNRGRRICGGELAPGITSLPSYDRTRSRLKAPIQQIAINNHTNKGLMPFFRVIATTLKIQTQLTIKKSSKKGRLKASKSMGRQPPSSPLSPGSAHNFDAKYKKHANPITLATTQKFTRRNVNYPRFKLPNFDMGQPSIDCHLPHSIRRTTTAPNTCYLGLTTSATRRLRQAQAFRVKNNQRRTCIRQHRNSKR